MPRFVSLVSFTEQGIRDIKNSIKRAERFKKLAAKHKVKVREIHWTMGKYDIVVTFDAPSDMAMSALTLDNAQLGNVRTETFRAYTREEFAEVLKAIQ
ncbi:MAG: GYD domain-containing protein [Candidatus Methylomirabilaceae bacterium]